MNPLETRFLDLGSALELREDSDGFHYLTGLVAPWSATYEFEPNVTEEFAPGVFSKSIRERGDKIPLLEQHSTDRFPIGQSVAWEETSEGLVAEFRLARTPRAEEARQLALDGDVQGMSVGFRPIRNRVEKRSGKKHVLRVEAMLDHVGMVNRSAYPTARVLAVREFDPDDPQSAPNLARARARLGLTVKDQ